MADDFERRIDVLEDDTAELKARYVAILGVLQALIIRLDDRDFNFIIELLDIPVPHGLGPSATSKADHFFSEFSEHLLSIRDRGCVSKVVEI